MSTATPDAVRSSDPEGHRSRAVRLLRVGVLLVAGLVIAFSATMHERLAFDLLVTSVSLAAIGFVHAAEWLRSPAPRSPITLLLAVVGLVGAAVVPLSGSTLGYAVSLAAWALASALLEFMGSILRPATRQDAVFLGAIGVLLAMLVLLVREDQVAVLGFFGGYAVIAGVFLGIAAFDPKRTTAGAPRRSPTSTESTR